MSAFRPAQMSLAELRTTLERLGIEVPGGSLEKVRLGQVLRRTRAVARRMCEHWLAVLAQFQHL